MKQKIINGIFMLFGTLLMLVTFFTIAYPFVSEYYNAKINEFNESQYPQVFSGEENKTIIIHLNKGNCVFKIDNITNANIMNPKTNTVLYTFTTDNVQYLYVPKTDAYILNISNSTDWTISYR